MWQMLRLAFLAHRAAVKRSMAAALSLRILAPAPIDKIILALGGKIVEELLDTLMTHHYTIVYASFCRGTDEAFLLRQKRWSPEGARDEVEMRRGERKLKTPETFSP